MPYNMGFYASLPFQELAVIVDTTPDATPIERLLAKYLIEAKNALDKANYELNEANYALSEAWGHAYNLEDEIEDLKAKHGDNDY